MNFSQRIGKESIDVSLQVNSIDGKLLNQLWNSFLSDFIYELGTTSNMGESELQGCCKYIWTDFFDRRIDEIPKWYGGAVHPEGVIKEIKKWFFSIEWDKVYQFLEFVVLCDKFYKKNFSTKFNFILEKYSSGYRVIDGIIVDITSQIEIDAIENAMSSDDKYKNVKEHLNKSLKYLSSISGKDYSNSIKESISAVESFCKILLNDKQITLGKALTEIERKYKLHGSLKSGISSLYGFASDAGGVRHGKSSEDIKIQFEDAKFILVICSSFFNYFISKING